MALSFTDLAVTLDDVESLYKDDKILDCLRLLRNVSRQYEVLSSGGNSTLSSVASTCSQVTEKDVRDRLESALFRRIRDEGERAEKLYESVMTEPKPHGDGDNQEDGWVLSYNGTDTKVWYKKNEQEDYDDENAAGIHSIRIQGTIQAPLLHVAALLYESDLYSSLFWYVSSSQILPLVEDESNENGDSNYGLKRAVHITTLPPWPLFRRDVTLYAYAVDALQSHNCVIVISSSISRLSTISPIVSHIPNPQPRVTRAIIHDSGFVMTPISPTATKACFTYHIDPKLEFIPLSVINWASRTMCRWSIRVLESKARNLEVVSPLHSRRLHQRPVYQRIRSRLQDYWTEQDGPIPKDEDLRKSGNFDPDARPSMPPIFKLMRNK